MNLRSKKWTTATTMNADDGDETRLESDKQNRLQRGQMTIPTRTLESHSFANRLPLVRSKLASLAFGVSFIQWR